MNHNVNELRKEEREEKERREDRSRGRGCIYKLMTCTVHMYTVRTATKCQKVENQVKDK